MTIRKVFLNALFAAAITIPLHGAYSQKGELQIARAARHEILSLPYLDVFDNISIRVQGETVTLMGEVTRPNLKSDAEDAIRGIEGVQNVLNQIEVLPLSPFDDRLRIGLFRAIYGYAPLQRYALPVIKPIRIIVRNGNVTLEGIVGNEMDKNLVNIRARGVHGVFSVTNNLAVENN